MTKDFVATEFVVTDQMGEEREKKKRKRKGAMEMVGSKELLCVIKQRRSIWHSMTFCEV